MEVKNRKIKIIVYVFLILVAILTLLPIVFTFLSSLTSSYDLYAGKMGLWPNNPSFENYINYFSFKKLTPYNTITFLSLVRNSFVVAAIDIAWSCIFSSMAAYVISRSKVPARKVFIFLLLLNFILGSGTITYAPLIKILDLLHIRNMFGLAIVQSTFFLPVLTLLNYTYIESIDRAIDYQAKLDGCSLFKTWYKIIVPLSGPAIATVAIMRFCMSFKNYLLAKLVLAQSKYGTTLAVFVSDSKSLGNGAATEYTLMMAGCVLSIIPLIFIFIFFNRYMVADLQANSTKY